jgi:hypothetical protein
MAAQAAQTSPPHGVVWVHPPLCPERGEPVFGLSLEALAAWMVRSPAPQLREWYKELHTLWSLDHSAQANSIVVVHAFRIEPTTSHMFRVPWPTPTQRELDLFEAAVRHHRSNLGLHTCVTCGRYVQLRRCSQCRQCNACSVACATVAWPAHKVPCRVERARRKAHKAAGTWPADVVHSV